MLSSWNLCTPRSTLHEGGVTYTRVRVRGGGGSHTDTHTHWDDGPRWWGTHRGGIKPVPLSLRRKPNVDIPADAQMNLRGHPASEQWKAKSYCRSGVWPYTSPPPSPPPGPRSRTSFERGGGGGTQKSVYQKWPDQIFPKATFRFFRRWSLWWGGGGVPLPWVFILLKTPSAPELQIQPRVRQHRD